MPEFTGACVWCGKRPNVRMNGYRIQRGRRAYEPVCESCYRPFAVSMISRQRGFRGTRDCRRSPNPLGNQALSGSPVTADVLRSAPQRYPTSERRCLDCRDILTHRRPARLCLRCERSRRKMSDEEQDVFYRHIARAPTYRCLLCDKQMEQAESICATCRTSERYREQPDEPAIGFKSDGTGWPHLVYHTNQRRCCPTCCRPSCSSPSPAPRPNSRTISMASRRASRPRSMVDPAA